MIEYTIIMYSLTVRIETGQLDFIGKSLADHCQLVATNDTLHKYNNAPSKGIENGFKNVVYRFWYH